MNRKLTIGASGLWAAICFLLVLASLASAAPYTDLYNFAGHSTDGMSPRGSLIQVGSVLYGMTNEGGKGAGTIFAFNPATNQESMLYAFGNNPDAENPSGSLIASGSTLYG